MVYLLRGILRNDKWKFFLERVMNKTPMMTSGKPSVQQWATYIVPVTAVLRLLHIHYDYLPWTLAIIAELWECYVSATICNIELRNEANFSYCKHCINPLFSIVISTTTINITTISITIIPITTITIASIGYFTILLFVHALYVPLPYQRSPNHRN